MLDEVVDDLNDCQAGTVVKIEDGDEPAADCGTTSVDTCYSVVGQNETWLNARYSCPDLTGPQ